MKSKIDKNITDNKNIEVYEKELKSDDTQMYQSIDNRKGK